MARDTRTALIWGSVAVVVVAFFLPWATAEFRDAKLFSKISTGMRRSLSHAAGPRASKAGTTPKGRGLTTVPTHVSGFQVPILANREQAKVATSLVELLTKQRQHIGLKSWLVYLIPGLAVLSGWLLTVHGARRRIRLGVGVGCAAIALLGVWRLLTVDTVSLFRIIIGPGLWLSLAGYAALAWVALAGVRPPRA